MDERSIFDSAHFNGTAIPNEATIMVTELRESLWPTSLRCHDLTLPTPEENLGLDEALLSVVDDDPSRACLRFWQPADYFVVLGRSNKAETEVALDFCQRNRIPTYRRATGGGTVLVGPGCLCYSLVLPLDDQHRGLGISPVTSALMRRTASALNHHLAGIEVRGTSDLVWHDAKFSGNAQRWLKRAFIHHGTLLFDFDLPLLESCLRHPTREPDYRRARPHREFVTNLPLSPGQMKASLRDAWHAIPADCPADAMIAISRIVAFRYTSNDWKISHSM